MTTQPPEQSQAHQVNTHGGVGFQAGYHIHNYGGGYPAGAATVASRQATNQGTRREHCIGEWAPADLGVHRSITVHDEVTVTPYLARSHDQDLRQHLTRAKDADRPTFIVVVGTSCTGKTRTLYEAVLDTLPTWPVAAPGSDSGLAKLLLDGIPANTIVWLDELQNQLTTTHDGITAAKAIRELLAADRIGSIVFAGTIWPSELAVLIQRPTAEQAARGAGALRSLFTRSSGGEGIIYRRGVEVVHVPDTFAEADLNNIPDDPRLRLVIDTATRDTNPEPGLRLTQVLAGGPQLVQRLYGRPADHRGFSPAARAIAAAAGDLRRVGMPNPLPHWALKGAAEGYLGGPPPPPGSMWFQTGLNQLTSPAAADDYVTGNHTLDLHADGVPALTPTSLPTPGGEPDFAYSLHDYLFWHHVMRFSRSPTRHSLWATLTQDQEARVPTSVAADACQRGLFSAAIALGRNRADAGDGKARQIVAHAELSQAGRAYTGDFEIPNVEEAMESARLQTRVFVSGDAAALSELRARANSGSWHGQEYFSQTLGELITARRRMEAERDTFDGREELRRLVSGLVVENLLTELRTRAGDDDPAARGQLATSLGDLAHDGDDDALDELRTRAENGDREAADEIARILGGRSREGDGEALSELRHRQGAGDWYADAALAELFAGNLSELAHLADAGSWHAEESLVASLGQRAGRGDEESLVELQARADTSFAAARELAWALASIHR